MTMKKLLMTLLLFFSVHTYSSDWFVIKNIYFQGLQRITADTALLNMPIQVGDTINNNHISRTIRDLFSTGNFDDIRIFRNKDTLIIRLKERPIIKNITFFGNKAVKTDVLKSNLDSVNIRIGEVMNLKKLSNIINMLTDFYYSIGKYNIKIKPIILMSSNNQVHLKLFFSEGVSAKIQRINIIGNKTFSTNELMKYFQLKDDVFWWKISSDKKYKQEKFVNDLESLRSFYLSRGYVNFTINSTNIGLTPDKENIYITINITEGDKYIISDIELNIDKAEHYNEINELITIKKNTIYNATKIKKIETNIKNILGHYGYAYPNIITELKTNIKNKTVKVNINVDSGHRFYVRQINFIGNHITKDSVLRREMRQMEGAWLGSDLVLLGQNRLKRTGFFEKVDVETKRIQGISDQVDIVYKVKERNTGAMNFGIGFGTESGISFQIGIQEENWLGTGNAVSMSAKKNDYSTYGELSLTDPYLSVHGISLNGRLFYNNFSAKDAFLSDYKNKIYGIDATLSFPFNEHNIFRMGTGFVHNSLSDMKPQVSMWRYLASIGETLNFHGTSYYDVNDFSIDLGWIYNNLDRGFFPTSGKKIFLNSKITIPGSDNQYYKIKFDASHYYPLNEDATWILLGKTQFGYGNDINGKELPFYENFYAGGVGTVRGFRSNNIGPKAVYLEKNLLTGQISPKSANPSTDAIGGNAIATASLELIIPSPFIDEQNLNLIRTSFFIDAGTVWDSHWRNTEDSWRVGMPDYGKPSNIRVSTGIALQWISPLGPLTFSYAKPLKYYTGDRYEEFQFNIGRTW
ncbi:MAG: outer membrane protein assembly factor BamA [Arsenophonus sp.]|nr:MAG: outer membrane protein assembly factor BamA [Arsenophonus sp.]